MTENARSAILVPLDFSGHSKVALRRALQVARLLDHDLALLHVIDTTSLGSPAAKRSVEEARASLTSLALESDPDRELIRIIEVLEGRPWQVILRVAESIRPEVIVVGKRGDGPAAVGMGSVAERVVRGASCDVLVVRENPSHA